MKSQQCLANLCRLNKPSRVSRGQGGPISVHRNERIGISSITLTMRPDRSACVRNEAWISERVSLCRSLFNSQLISLANKIFFWSASSFLPTFQPSANLHACAAMRARGCILRIHELHPYTYCGPENKNKNKKSARLTVTLFHCFIKFSITYEDKVDKCCYCLL